MPQSKAMPRRHAFVGLAIAVALAGGVAALAMNHGGEADARKVQKIWKPGKKKTYAQLTAANYKILKPTQTTRLLEYADAAYSCMSNALSNMSARPSSSPSFASTFRPPGGTHNSGAGSSEAGPNCSPHTHGTRSPQ